MKKFILVVTLTAGMSTVVAPHITRADDDFFEKAFGSGEGGYDRFRAVSGKKLRAIVSNRRIYLHTPLGTKLPINYASDGTMTGEGGALAKYLSSRKYVINDTGRWWITRNFLCQQWQNWLKSKKTCIQAEIRGNKINWRSDDGEKGTATLGPRLKTTTLSSPLSTPCAQTSPAGCTRY